MVTIFYHSFNGWGQNIPAATQQQLENLTNADQAETEDDSYLQQLEQFRKNPVDMNTAEAAADKNFHQAFINGLLISVDPRVDLSLLHRHIDKEYQAINGNAFTENISPSNESGIYAGLTIRLTDNWQLNAYSDMYKFPWLKYLVDAPGMEKIFLHR